MAGSVVAERISTFPVTSLFFWCKAQSPAGVRLSPVIQYPNTIWWLVME